MPEPADSPALPPPEEEVDALPVLAEARPIERPTPAPLPAVVAAGAVGFLAGVAAWVLMRVLRRPRGSRAVRALGRRRARGLEISGTRSFLVDIHLLRDR
jgi:hypothetical protein